MRSSMAFLVLTTVLGLVGCGDKSRAKMGPTERYDEPAGMKTAALEIVHEFRGAMPTGVAVDRTHRVFVNYPRWEDPIEFTVAEIKDGREVPYPNADMNKGDTADKLFSVQSVVVDAKNRLWALDTGTVNMGPIKGFEWPKLVGFDLKTNKPFRTIRFPRGVITEKTYLNDVRFDLDRGAEGMAFITDSSAEGANGIIVVDLASGRSWRTVHDDPSTKADKDFISVMDGKPMMLDKKNEPPKPVTVGADGIAVSGNKQRLFYCPLSSRSLYSVSLDLLADEKSTDAQIVKDMTKEARNFASDGLEADAQGRLYLTDYEHNAIVVRLSDGTYKTVIGDPRMQWPDSLALGWDGRLYFTCNQLHRQAKFQDGTDKREKPYYLFCIRTESKPVGIEPISRTDKSHATTSPAKD